jgi:hypothetical protein
MKERKKVSYRPPQIWIRRVVLESGIAVAVSVDFYDWEDGGTIGGVDSYETDGGDILLF